MQPPTTEISFVVSINDRCKCERCEIMGTEQACLCCCEVERVVAKRDGAGQKYKCITEHPGFAPVCLQTEVLDTAYWHYRCIYGSDEDSKTTEEKVFY
jgi:hypothetical protein